MLRTFVRQPDRPVPNHMVVRRIGADQHDVNVAVADAWTG
jgi:hypothetical protein